MALNAKLAVIDALINAPAEVRTVRPAPGGTGVQYEAELPLRELRNERNLKYAELRRCLALSTKRFDPSIKPPELADAVSDMHELMVVFCNNIITVYLVENMLAVWRILAACATRITVDVTRVSVRFVIRSPKPGAAATPDGDTAQLIVHSVQRWHVYPILILVRLVFGEYMLVHVTTTLTFSARGRVTSHHDYVHNWLSVPAPVRLLLGLTTPACVTLFNW